MRNDRPTSDYIEKFESEGKTRGGNAEIDCKESDSPLSRGVLFGNSEGVTLIVYLEGFISIPAVSSYDKPNPTPVIAAASAKELWARQKRRDDANPDRAKHRAGGHLGPVVDPDRKCRNDGCPCQKESPEDRKKRARDAYNTNPDRCS